MPGERFIGSSRLWSYPLRMEVDEIEIGGLYEDTSVGGLAPRIVCVLSVNGNGTVTVIETWYQDTRSVKVEHLWGIDFLRVPPWEEVDVPPGWADWPTRPRCPDEYNIFH